MYDLTLKYSVYAATLRFKSLWAAHVKALDWTPYCEEAYIIDCETGEVLYDLQENIDKCI